MHDIPAVIVSDLVKCYGNNRAVDGVSFQVQRGEVLGLLGPNGAGKTTTVEILEGLRRADSGSALVLGLDVKREAQRVKQRIGVATQTSTLLPNLTCYELLRLWSRFYPHPLAPDALLETLGLVEKRRALVQTLSGGQQQRLSIALALVGDPELLFLDEPTTGLDPQARRSLWEVIEALRKTGKTVVLTTHYMEEAERLCDRIAIIDHGRLLALDTPAALVRAHFEERVIHFRALLRTELALGELPGVTSVVVGEDGDVALHTQSVQQTLGALLERAEAHRLELGEIRLGAATLEDVFLKLTGRSIRD